GEGAPVGYVAGAIDLLYKDGETGAVVVADYKTDEIQEDEALAARAAAYAPQGAAYVKAGQEALGLPAPPRFQLWFLPAGGVLPPLGTSPRPVRRPPASLRGSPKGLRASPTPHGPSLRRSRGSLRNLGASLNPVEPSPKLRETSRKSVGTPLKSFCPPLF